MTVGPIVAARSITKYYRSAAGEVIVPALRDVSLTIEPGELLAVMGPSGCGKTTLLNTLSGLDSLDKGEIRIVGQPLHQLSDARRTALRARQMGFVFQSYNLLPVFTAVENVELPLLMTGTGADPARRRALEALEQVKLADRAHHRPNQLSGGQQQRVAIARALINRPAIVWADEPTGNLDSAMAQGVLELVVRLNRTLGQTFVIVTHDPAVGQLADRLIQMQDGRIIADAAPRARHSCTSPLPTLTTA